MSHLNHMPSLAQSACAIMGKAQSTCGPGRRHVPRLPWIEAGSKWNFVGRFWGPYFVSVVQYSYLHWNWILMQLLEKQARGLQARLFGM